MKTITLTAYNRPDHLRQVIESLQKNNLTGYTLYCFVEPGNQNVYRLCQGIQFVQKHVIVNHRRLGVKENPYQGLKFVFDHGSLFNVYLEDDVILAPDAFNLANWYASQMEETLCLNLFTYKKAGDPKVIRRSKGFSALGLGIKKTSWDKWFQPSWHLSSRGWDWSITELLEREGKLQTLLPDQSRTNHIGRLGTHCTADFHDQTFPDIKISDGSYRGPYEVI